ncbi:uncharacterized protein LOC128823096 isoform X3 [Malaclemys terrapin pileata]|uniref:uncharacterized protein LOC128823096 isoform X3 n=1 Tax=Malaclemys terrapin pileata TaxID=2991368 RepID=UPI0023A84610|nr:uncharacterized protein LOC128823096 isoform X3 [Malaclemys terrapin pileata]
MAGAGSAARWLLQPGSAKQTEAERQKIVWEWKELRGFLEEQEQRLLSRLEELERAIVQRRDEGICRLSWEFSLLSERGREKGQQPLSQPLQEGRDVSEAGAGVCGAGEETQPFLSEKRPPAGGAVGIQRDAATGAEERHRYVFVSDGSWGNFRPITMLAKGYHGL